MQGESVRECLTVVIGANGFVGKAVMAALKEAGLPALGLDILPGNGVQVVDILNLDDLCDAVPPGSTIIHLAGPVAGGFTTNFDFAWRLQVQGTSNVLVAAARQSCQRLIFASSYHVYIGTDRDLLVDEATVIPETGLDGFGASKLLCEQMTRAFCFHQGIELVTLRFGSVYGLGNCTNLMSELFAAAENGEKVEIWGNGLRTNHFVYLDDLARACTLALKAEPALYNLLDPRRYSIREICEIAEDELGVKSVFDPTKKERPSFPTIGAERFTAVTSWVAGSLSESFRKVATQLEFRSVA